MTTTCPDCHATVLSTSQPERVGSTAEMRDALTEAVRLFESYGLIAGRTEADPLAAGRWINNARAALAATPAVGGERIPLADHDEIGRKILGQPWAIQSAIVTIAAHCTVLTDKHPTGDVADLAGCISEACLELANALAPPASPLRGRVDIEMLLALLNPLHGSLDLQVTEQFTDERELDPPKDREYSVNVTWQMERDLTQAVCILENRLRNV